MSRESQSAPSTVPTPPHPLLRQEPLPSQCRKSPEEDPEAHARVEQILHSRSYRPADEDLEFLGSDAMRGVRLQIDFFKPEHLLQQHHIRNAVVVFGSTRICEPAEAQRQVDEATAALQRDTGNPQLAHRLEVAKRILAKSRYYDIAREFGRLVSCFNYSIHDPHTVILTGGGPGIMEAANRGAFDVNAKSVGLNISLPREQFPNPYVTPDLCFQFHYFTMRKLHFLLRARALVAFPGGYGTFDELFEVLTLIQTRKMKPIPVVLVGEQFWRKAVNFDFLIEEGVIAREDRDLFWFAEAADEIWDGILRWHESSGEPLRPNINGGPSPPSPLRSPM